MAKRRKPPVDEVLECAIRGPCRVTGERRGWPIGVPVERANRRSAAIIWTAKLVEFLRTARCRWAVGMELRRRP